MKLTDIKTIYICPDHNEKYNERKLYMDNLLSSIGFTNLSHYKSGTDAYPKCLCDANIDILQNNLDNPILILKDDLGYIGMENIEIPEDADAIYLGLSKSGGHPTENRDLGSSVFAPYSDKLVRVGNMLATHSILYISRRYKEAVIDVLKNINQVYHMDVLISRIQKDFNIYALKTPIFYQSAKFGNVQHVENWTKFRLA
jgi:hypothetical protein